MPNNVPNVPRTRTGTPMRCIELPLAEIHPYINNPRRNTKAVRVLANAIKELGYRNYILVDKDYTIISGHTRLEELKMLGWGRAYVLVAEDMSPEQVKAHRLADNKIAELSEWDDELLAQELSELADSFDMSMFGFDFKELEQERNIYTSKVDVPQYQITGEEPPVSSLMDTSKKEQLVREIENADIPSEVKDFLIAAASRHIVFDYQKIAEYYAHADAKIQRLMEDSALVIIDFDDAIRNGYCRLESSLNDILQEEYDA